MNELESLILCGKFQKAEKLFYEQEIEEAVGKLQEIAFDTQNILVYTFVIHLILQRETSKLHLIASELMALPFCFIEGGYSTAFYHAKKAVELSPQDSGLKEFLLFFHEIPDTLLSKEESIDIAIEVVKEIPNSKPASKVLKRYNIK
ncbi:hypothetical protein [Chengkuizengella axinellae]|uniref:Tetratricopeptide repeat protein n=1 Tax=Chengkuizengella axinellae TaxID=3064388 RepID=A0ABT9IU90_9BACL|nr:hypothetical protein [Chengkuizengella sp. 2205SS18-9]MDP5272914.1 hypothetical protein [Chengkuizengella sp. 2205SS18-9]